MAQRMSGYAREPLLTMQATYLFRSQEKGGRTRLQQASRKTGIFHSQEGFFLRTERDGVRVEDGFEDAVRDWRTSDLTERERLAAEYAERYAEDHHGLEPGVDPEFWERFFAAYSQREVVELTMCLGSWLAFGRLNRVLGLDVACVLPSHPQKAAT